MGAAKIIPANPKGIFLPYQMAWIKDRARLNNGHVVGGHQNGLRAMNALGIDWMTGTELSQSVPPAYTEWIGRQLIAAIRPVTSGVAISLGLDAR